MMWAFQAVGLLALLLDVSSVQFKYRKHILFVQILASLVWAAHFILIGAVAGAMMNLVGVVRSTSYYAWRESRPMWVVAAVIILSIVVTGYTWQGPASLLPMAAMALAAIAFWQRSEQMIRILLLAAVPLWFGYNLLFHSYAGMASDTIAVLAIVTALYRYRQQGIRKAASIA